MFRCCLFVCVLLCVLLCVCLLHCVCLFLLHLPISLFVHLIAPVH